VQPILGNARLFAAVIGLAMQTCYIDWNVYYFALLMSIPITSEFSNLVQGITDILVQISEVCRQYSGMEITKRKHFQGSCSILIEVCTETWRAAKCLKQ
jgi:hypothetical protein